MSRYLPWLTAGRRSIQGSPIAHLGAENNLVGNFYNKYGDIEEAFAADHVLNVDFLEHRGGCHAMECRNILVNYDASLDETTIHLTTQAPFLIRRLMARFLEEDESRIRIVCPDVGGGFGPKNGPHPGICACYSGKKPKRPVKWIEDRREHFTATSIAGDQQWSMEIACDNEGKILVPGDG